jgi:tRNA(Ile2)-agmatinylcytidine synthase
MILRIGVDDTDSKDGMCTTYIGAVIVDGLKGIGAELIDFPHLIRLNPNWPLKTRGNCSVTVSVKIKAEQAPAVKKIVLNTVRELAELRHKTTNPGVTFLEGKKIPAKLRKFSKKVVQDVVTIEGAEALAREIGAEIHKFKLGRGIIGALAAIGNPLEHDWTFELIAYRARENWGTPRRIDARSVEEMNAKTFPANFDNLDPFTEEIRITPHTPCPILYGIRGESAETVLKAHKLVNALEPIERWVIYKTNQATDEHLRKARISEVKPLRSFILEGEVSKKPKIIPGGHVIFELKDKTGKIDCAAYEPTRGFREVVKHLLPGDHIRVYGGVKDKPRLPRTLNLEKLCVLKLKPILHKVNPSCPKCGKRMTSEGRNKGYSCKGCKIKAPPEAVREVKLQRKIDTGLFEVPPRARRHLAMPLIRVKRKREY